MKIWTTSQAHCPFCGLESTHSKNCRWVMTLEQLFRAVRNNRTDYINMGHHPEGDTLRCLSDLLEMHPIDAAPTAPPKKEMPLPDARIVGEVFAKDAPPPTAEAAAAQVLAALRYARDFEQEKWDALMTTEAGVLIMKAWDALKAILPKK
jgi:hypothetical protein